MPYKTYCELLTLRMACHVYEATNLTRLCRKETSARFRLSSETALQASRPVSGWHKHRQKLRLLLHDGIKIFWHLKLRDVLQVEHLC